MTWKGHEFTEDDLPKREVAAAKAKLGEGYDAWLQEKLQDQTEKYRIVATDENGDAIIGEELDQRAINALSDSVRSVAGSLLALSQDDRAAVLAAFESDGTLKYPFNMKDARKR